MDKKYCSKCGKELIEKIIPANEATYSKHMYPGSGITTVKVATKYDPQTGEKNYATVKKCPDYKAYIFGMNNGHTREVSREVAHKVTPPRRNGQSNN